MDKIVHDGEKKDIGLNKLEVAIHRIKIMLSDATPTLEFAKECIEEYGGKEVMLYNLRNALDAEKRAEESKERGRIWK